MGREDGYDFQEESKKRWQKLVQIHNQAKSVFLCAEEFDPVFKDFVQPVLELRHALEHIVRANADQMGINGAAVAVDEGYVLQSLDKALGHEYRAFFDAADWFSVCIRARIIDALRPYSHECVAAVLTDYYPQLRPRVDATCKEIAAIRESKDIARKDDLLPEVQKYRDALDELLAIHDRIHTCIPALADWRRKDRRAALKGWVAAALVGGAITAIATAWAMRVFGPGPVPSPEPPSTREKPQQGVTGRASGG